MKTIVFLGLLLGLGSVGCLEYHEPDVVVVEKKRGKRGYHRGRDVIWRDGCKYRFRRSERRKDVYKITQRFRHIRSCPTYQNVWY